MPISRRKLLAGLSAITAAVGFGAWRATPFRYYDGPLTDHWDGTRFGDAHSIPPKDFADLWRWYRENNKAEWPDHLDNEFSDKPPARVEGKAWRICHVGHATNLIQTAGLNILTAPDLVGARIAVHLSPVQNARAIRHRFRRPAENRHRAGDATITTIISMRRH